MYHPLPPLSGLGSKEIFSADFDISLSVLPPPLTYLMSALLGARSTRPSLRRNASYLADKVVAHRCLKTKRHPPATQAKTYGRLFVSAMVCGKFAKLPELLRLTSSQ